MNSKIYIAITGFLICMSLNAQVAIGKTTVDGGGLLDFASGTTNGIILPTVETLPTSPANGTFVMYKTDAKLKMFENNRWVDLSDAGNVASVSANPANDLGEGVIIGAETSSAQGVLILESTDKALILPKITTPHLNVKSPYPGMICYDTTSKTIAVFDGINWSYWK